MTFQFARGVDFSSIVTAERWSIPFRFFALYLTSSWCPPSAVVASR